jgi:hypothetical protein
VGHGKSGENMAFNMTICSVALLMQRSELLRYQLWIGGPGMSQPLIATLIGVGVVTMVLLAIMGLTRPKRITLVDYPELPAPPKDDTPVGAGRQS